MRFALLVLFGTLLGCGVEDPCRVICEKEDECGISETGDIESCVSQCEAFSDEDPGYADAVQERANCVEETACSDISFECAPSGE